MPAAPASTYVYSPPLEQQLWDKDLNVPLAAGVVSFYSDDGHTIPKDVYIAGATVPYTNVGSELTLSSIGTFVYLGSNFVPFLWPFEGDPSSPPDPLVSEPYYIKVVSEDGVEQFTVDNWPPNVSESSSSSGGVTEVVQQHFTASGVYTPTADMAYCIIECLGAGGGGAGVANAAGVQTVGGGGAGGYSRTVATSALIGVSQVVTIGTAGAGGAASATNGAAGTATSVGSLCIANGGSGGISATSLGGAGATAGTGDLAAPGAPGFSGINTALNTTTFTGAAGASTQWGGGGISVVLNSAGAAGTGYGSGGSGGTSANSSGAQAGGAGAPGYVWITEYISS